jgi:EAL domain-containing protein (putative c-di-GMP-specific phosphodiesterase class I)
VDPALLTLEITEGVVIGNVEETIARMKMLRSLGLHFSIDDFGTGYSSLAYLKRLPISELKIDKAFIQEAPVQADDAALVETILSVAAHMRLKVVAEGVETEAQARFLAERAPAVVLQGFLLGRPAAAEDWLARWRQDGSLPMLAALPQSQAETQPERPAARADATLSTCA